MVRGVPTLGSARARRALVVLAVGLLALTAIPVAGAVPPRAASYSTTVLYITQTPSLITEQDRFTIAMDLASSANIDQVYFTFCQLTSSVCYLPVSMLRTTGNLWVGTTGPMTHYNGMNVGVRAGYNITIEYNDTTVQNEPAVPNMFGNLTVAQSVTGEYMYQITVGQFTYGLSGRVVDSVTGAAVPGAAVSVNATNVSATTTDANGAYSFPALPNGTYTLNVTKAGYPKESLAVSIAGGAATKNVTLSGTVPPPPAKKTNATSLLSGPVVYLIAGIAIAAILGVILALMLRRRGPRADPPTGG